MNSNSNDKSIPEFSNINNWFFNPLGSSLLTAEQQQLDSILPKIFGDYLVKIGGLAPLSSIAKDFLAASSIRKKIYLSSEPLSSLNNIDIIQCNYDELPLVNESIDTIIIHHVLEFAINPLAILKEAAQTLSPQGQLIIIGLNPFSLWGLKNSFIHSRFIRKFFGRKSKDMSITPWQGRFISASRIRVWLDQLNLTTTKISKFYFRPPINNKSFLQRTKFLEKLGKLLHLPFGACYILMAEKNIAGITLIKNHSVAHKISLGYLKPWPQPDRSQILPTKNYSTDESSNETT